MSLGLAAGVSATGAVGAVCRYLLAGVAQRRTASELPWGTFIVNVSGSLVLGVVTGAALYHALPNTPRTLLATGFCGAYTTFSTFTFETVRLLEEGDVGAALANALGSVVAGCAAAAAGLALAALF